jgi:hypothetical protein
MDKEKEDFIESIKNISKEDAINIKKQIDIKFAEDEKKVILGTKDYFTLLDSVGIHEKGSKHLLKVQNGVPLKTELVLPLEIIVKKGSVIDWAVYEWVFNTYTFKFTGKIIKKEINW